MNLKGLKEIKAKLTREALVLPIASRAIKELTAIAEAAAKLNAPRDSGGLVNSIVSEVAPLQGRVHIIGAYQSHRARIIEFGRGAGKKQPPASSLALWASRHGFGSDKRGIFLLARSISRRGIKGRFFIKRARILTRRQMPRIVEQMGKEAEAIWGRGGTI